MAAVFYDAIPCIRPDLCNEELRRDHALYMQGLAECDLVIPISFYSATCLTDFWRDKGVKPAVIETNPLPAEFGGAERIGKSSIQDNPRTVRILCVSTLEPRKNHRKLIQACQHIGRVHPELEWKLTLVGNKYQGGDDLAAFVERTTSEDRRIEWLGIVDDDKLVELYRQADLTVYPSMIEGYGLPIVESIWYGKPCICHQEGVMAELASEGGCVTVDVMDSEALAETIYRLSTDAEQRLKLSTEAVSRKLQNVGRICDCDVDLTGQGHNSQAAYARKNTGACRELSGYRRDYLSELAYPKLADVRLGKAGADSPARAPPSEVRRRNRDLSGRESFSVRAIL